MLVAVANNSESVYSFPLRNKKNDISRSRFPFSMGFPLSCPDHQKLVGRRLVRQTTGGMDVIQPGGKGPHKYDILKG